MTAHSVFAPSSAHVWGNCEGSASLAMLFPEPETDATREGTAAHWVLEQQLLAPHSAHDQLEGAEAPNGYPVSEDMRDAALDTYLLLQKELGDHWVGRLVVEERVAIPHVHEKCYGTIDLSLWCEASRTLYIRDYKYGFGFVSAFENEQLMCYASGKLHQLGLNVWDEGVTIDFGIYQPRCYFGHKDEQQWRITAAQLQPYIEHLSVQAHRALSPESRVRSGDWCKHCPGRHECKAAGVAAGNALDYVAAPQPLNLTPSAVEFELATLRRAKRALEARLSGIEAVAEDLLRKGETLRGFKLEQGKGKRVWNIPPATVFSISQYLANDGTAIDLAKPAEPLTPFQAEKKLKEKGVDAAVIKDYISTPKGGMKLVEDDGSRARFIFSNQQETSNV